MTRSEGFSLTRVPVGQNETPRAELLFNGSPTGVTIPGIVLEAQYRSGDSHLLLTTEDVPFEDALHLLLLDERLVLLDHVELAHPYAAGLVKDVRPAGGERLTFSFFGGDLWETTVMQTPRRLKRAEAPTGVRGRLRRLLVPRWLAVKRLR
jgi:hypothetical protein